MNRLAVAAAWLAAGLALAIASYGAARRLAGPAQLRAEDVIVPPGMAFVPGGRTRIGAEDGAPEEAPPFLADVQPFFMDRHPVTVGEFAKFVEATGYVTDAERTGDAAVYDPVTGGWRLVAGASWRRPLGGQGPEAATDHPVTQVTWFDAVAYARWIGKRLPTEIEWEHAARAGVRAGDRYAWGDTVVEDGRWRANVWQGPFPGGNTGEDGHRLTSPVGTFGPTALGLVDMGGNVWEWTADWFRPYAERDRPFDPATTAEKVQRGGSFLCHPRWCHGYRVSARGRSTPETALFHTGFRLVRDIAE